MFGSDDDSSHEYQKSSDSLDNSFKHSEGSTTHTGNYINFQYEEFDNDEADNERRLSNLADSLVNAVIKDNIDVVREYLQHPEIDDFIEYGSEDKTALDVAIKHERIDIIKHFFNVKPELFHTTQRVPPLHNAVALDKLNVAKLLLKEGAVLNINQRYDIGTPLHHAATKGCSEDMIQFLIENGADINSQDAPCERTPLHCAIKFGHEKVVNILVNTDNINLNLYDDEFNTPLQIAQDNAKEKKEQKNIGAANRMINILIKNGATIHIKNDELKVSPSSLRRATRKSTSDSTPSLLFTASADSLPVKGESKKSPSPGKSPIVTPNTFNNVAKILLSRKSERRLHCSIFGNNESSQRASTTTSNTMETTTTTTTTTTSTTTTTTTTVIPKI